MCAYCVKKSILLCIQLIYIDYSFMHPQVMGGTNWVRNVLATTALFCGPLLVVFAFLNTVAIVYRSTAALPFGTICIIFVIWALITFPLTVLGGIAGKNSKARAPGSSPWLLLGSVMRVEWVLPLRHDLHHLRHLGAHHLPAHRASPARTPRRALGSAGGLRSGLSMQVFGGKPAKGFRGAKSGVGRMPAAF